MPSTYPYPRPALTADAVVFTIQDQRLLVLLIRRAGEPFAGLWALPGGFVEEGESSADAVKRELAEEAGVHDVWFEQLKTFDAPGRDPRGWVVTVAHFALIDSERVRPVGADDAAEAQWWPMDGLPPLAFDHGEILRYALERLRNKLRWSNIGAQLLPPLFTMEALRRVHEAVLDGSLDKRNFHKRMLESGTVQPTGERLANGKRGPRPRLYSFTSQAGD